MLTDPIANMLVKIKNAGRAGKEKVDVLSSNMAKNILTILKKEGYIKSYKEIKDNKQGVLRVYLRMDKTGLSAITDMKRVSKPGRRIYVANDEIPNVLGNMGLAVMSTSIGVITNKEARQKKVGGEVICYVW